MATSTQSDRSGGGVTPLFAVVGATDLAVERVRAVAANASVVQAQFEARVAAVQADVGKRVAGFDARSLRSQAQEVPIRAAGRALVVAGRAEAAYSELARRGQDLVERVRTQPSTQDFIAQAESTLSRGRAAVTVARKAADETATALLGTLSVGRREAAEVAEETSEAVVVAVKNTRESATRTATTTRKRAAAVNTSAKGARTSAGRTTKKAGNAVKSSAAAKSGAKKAGD